MQQLLGLWSIVLVAKHQTQKLLHRYVLYSESDDLDSLRVVDFSESFKLFQSFCLSCTLQLGAYHELEEDNSE